MSSRQLYPKDLSYLFLYQKKARDSLTSYSKGEKLEQEAQVLFKLKMKTQRQKEQHKYLTAKCSVESKTSIAAVVAERRTQGWRNCSLAAWWIFDVCFCIYLIINV